MNELEVIKAGVHAFTHDEIIFDIAGLDFVEAVRYMPPGTWNLIQVQNTVKLFRAQGGGDAVKKAFLASGLTIQKIYEVVDNHIDWPTATPENCSRCGGLKYVGMECNCEYWGRDIPGEIEKDLK